MAYKNKFLFIFTFALLGLPSMAYAQLKEALDWRVESTLPKLESAPSYASERTPFPYKERPAPVVKVEVKREVPRELTVEQRNSLRAADLLNEIRAILNNEEIFNADVSGVTVEAIIKSMNSRTALIKNQWIEVGETIEVPIEAKDSLQEMIENLKGLDPNLASIVEAQVEEKVRVVQNLKLVVTQINEDNVHMTDNTGYVHVINFKLRNL